MVLLHFPNIDPVLVQIGPFAIRWYALAYVATILLGWRYVVGMVRNPKLWTYRPRRRRRPTRSTIWSCG